MNMGGLGEDVMTGFFRSVVPGMVLLALLAPPILAVEGDEHWSPAFALPGAGGTVYASLAFGGDLIVAGDFLHVGTSTANRIARWDGDSWHAMGAGLDDTVYALAEYEGALYAGGLFAHSGQSPVQGVARWDGVAWQPLPEPLGFYCIKALAVYNGRLIAGGIANYDITEEEWSEVAGLAAWDGAIWTELADFEWYLYCSVDALTVFDGDLIVGGSFEQLNGDWDFGGIARWDGAAWHSMGSARGTTALLVHNGALYAANPELRRWQEPSWVLETDGLEHYGGVFRLASFEGDILAAGGFQYADGQLVRGLARWDGVAWLPFSELIDPLAGTWVYTVCDYEGQLVAGGWFRRVGPRAAFALAGWDGQSWGTLASPGDEEFFRGLDAESLALANFSGDLAVAGYFRYGGDTLLNGVGLWNGSDWQSLGSGLPGGDRVWAMAEYQGKLVVTGNFHEIGGVASLHMAQWAGSAWEPFGEGSAPEGRELFAAGTDLYVGGDFATAGGLPAENIACWDGTGWSDLDGGLNDRVYALLMMGGDLLAAGSFIADAHGAPLNRVARWDGAVWSPLSQGFNGIVSDLVVWNGALIAGGYFNQADGASTPYLAIWDGAAWQPFPSGPNGYVTGLAVYNGELVVCGRFSELGGIPASFIGSWDGTNWSPLGSGLALSDWGAGMYMRDLQVLDNQLFVAGSFRNAGGKASYGIACWREDLTAVLAGGPPAGGLIARNVPNPFNPSTEIVFTLPAAAPVTLRIVDAVGRCVRTLLTATPLPAGKQRVSWDGRDDEGRRLPSGAYVYELEAGGRRAASKMLLLQALRGDLWPRGGAVGEGPA